MKNSTAVWNCRFLSEPTTNDRGIQLKISRRGGICEQGRRQQAPGVRIYGIHLDMITRD